MKNRYTGANLPAPHHPCLLIPSQGTFLAVLRWTNRDSNPDTLLAGQTCSH